MQLHPEWKAILMRSWTIRFVVLAALGGFGEGIVQVVTSGISFSAGFALLIGGVNAAAAASRVIVQRGLATAVASNAKPAQ